MLVNLYLIKFKRVSETLLYGFMMLAQSLAFAPAFTAALVSGHRIFQILDRKSLIQDISSTSTYSKLRPTKNKPANPNEGIRYDKVEFKYPKQKDVAILQGLDLEVKLGKTVALVGTSGSGKSTCLELLQRYYDPNNGSIVNFKTLILSICTNYYFITFII